ncbi:methyltransferase C-terminal domain-containing protein [Piscicoccus intestinalis]|uniref:methyltransferase C-terminal domain-containing protein n=1 Tax=Piscicoccus intestinalis TaxID=746033 RepID=UPI0008383FE8|nr:methyltransferase C-terminal domain-containing protein [Piscicoccus intestinalis]
MSEQTADASGAVRVTACRGCGCDDLTGVIDLGMQSACDHFPPLDDPADDPRWPLGLVLCGRCALLQLDHDSPAPEEPLAVESATLQAHARDASRRLLERIEAPAGLRVREFSSHHGGSWLGALTEAGCRPVDSDAQLVIDNHSIIHAEALEPEFAERVAALADDGLLAIEFHHALAQLEQGQFDTVRHGHPLYFSLHSWAAACRRHGLSVVDAWTEDVFGGCLVVLARRGEHEPSKAAQQILDSERRARATSPEGYRDFAAHAATTVAALREHVRQARAAGRTVAAYGAGSKAVTMLGVAGLTAEDLPLVADLGPGKQGRRIPGAGIAIVSPEELIAAAPDDVIILTWDIAPEVVAQLRRGGLTDARFYVPLPTFAQVS